MINQTVNLIAPGDQSDTIEGHIVMVGHGRAYKIEGITTLGRDPSNDIRIDDPHISAFHCQFEKRHNGFYIRDLKSKNGIEVNGLRITEAQLVDGAHIVIGETRFGFQSQKPRARELNLTMSSRNLSWNDRLVNIHQIARTDLPVFLNGESGTGKDVVAHLIHEVSDRRNFPFVSVNCSALTETLVESELFGHVRGSFTGATGDRRGAFEAARGGTLFLDEIGDLPLSLQPKLLRAIENKEIRPVGSDQDIPTDVRIISATHKDIRKLVAEGKFRSDLYFRIHVLSVYIPALRERMEDFEDILYDLSRELRVRFSVPAIQTLKNHCWPGNVRELKNVVSRAHALFPQTYIQPEQIAQLIDTPVQPPFELINLQRINPAHPGLPVMKELEREVIKKRLIVNNGNQRKTAADLGIPKSTLHDRIKAYGIEIKSLLNIQ